MLIYGLSVALVGMGTVFCGLVILIGFIKGMEKVMPYITNGNLGDLVKDLTAKRPMAAQPQSSIVIETSNVNNDEVVAVIAATVSAIMEEEQKNVPAEKKGFVVRSIRRVSNAPAWNRAGREEQVYSRM